MENSDDFNPSNTQLRITDAASMLRKMIDLNERPFMKSVLKSNNSVVDDWSEQVLSKICNSNGCIRAGQMWPEWQYYYTGRMIKSFMNHIKLGFVMRYPQETIDFWIKTFLEYSIDQLIELGSPLVGYGWKIIIDEIFIRNYVNKWEKIYSQSDNPLIWRKLANDNPNLWNDTDEYNFWSSKDHDIIMQKVMTILKTPIAPEK